MLSYQVKTYTRYYYPPVKSWREQATTSLCFSLPMHKKATARGLY